MTVLITGGAGFIGSHLAERLVKDGFEVIVLDDLSTGKEGNLAHFSETHSLKFVRGDVRNPDTVRQCFDDVSVVVHLAGMTSVRKSIQSPDDCAEINVTGTANVLKACVESKVSKLLYASSSAVYGDTKEVPIAEEQPLQAKSPYAASKISGESLCAAYDGISGLDTVCLRFFNVYGPRQGTNGCANVITKFLDNINSSSPLVIYGNGQQTRDFIHVDDIVAILEQFILRETNARVYNVGTGRGVTINYLAESLLKLTGDKVNKPIYLPAQPGEVQRSEANIYRLTNEFGFVPKVKLEQGLHNLIKDDTSLTDL